MMRSQKFDLRFEPNLKLPEKKIPLPLRIVTVDQDFNSISINSNGRNVLYLQNNGRVNVWVKELQNLGFTVMVDGTDYT